jgi:N-dimethylarginine dimethylaminohydrolase
MKRARYLMCPPSHFGVEYIINPWMEGQINATSRELASEQWTELHAILSGLADVSLLEPVAGLPDMVFTANAGLTRRGTAVLSSFRHPERQPEETRFEACLTSHGFRVEKLPREAPFEGAGDALFDRQLPLLWFGHGIRSSAEARPIVERYLDIEAEPLRLRDSRFYHLDTCFCPLEGGYLLYFPAAFDEAGNRRIEMRVPPGKRLAVSERDAGYFACNAVNVGETVILNRASEGLKQELQSRGFVVVETPMTEFIKSGGAAKCLTLRLDEA